MLAAAAQQLLALGAAAQCVPWALTLDFNRSTIPSPAPTRGNDLGSHGVGEMLFSGVGAVDGEPYALRITSPGVYAAYDERKNGKSDSPFFAQINLLNDHALELELRLVDARGAPLRGRGFGFTVFDIDQTALGPAGELTKEVLCVCPDEYDFYTVAEHTSVRVVRVTEHHGPEYLDFCPAGCDYFGSTAALVPNPSAGARALSAEQQRAAVFFHTGARPRLRLRYATPCYNRVCRGDGGRNFFFGDTRVGSCPPLPPAPPAPPSPPRAEVSRGCAPDSLALAPEQAGPLPFNTHSRGARAYGWGGPHPAFDDNEWRWTCGVCERHRCGRGQRHNCAHRHGFVDPRGAEANACACACCFRQCAHEHGCVPHTGPCPPPAPPAPPALPPDLLMPTVDKCRSCMGSRCELTNAKSCAARRQYWDPQGAHRERCACGCCRLQCDRFNFCEARPAAPRGDFRPRLVAEALARGRWRRAWLGMGGRRGGGAASRAGAPAAPRARASSARAACAALGGGVALLALGVGLAARAGRAGRARRPMAGPTAQGAGGVGGTLELARPGSGVTVAVRAAAWRGAAWLRGCAHGGSRSSAWQAQPGPLGSARGSQLAAKRLQPRISQQQHQQHPRQRPAEATAAASGVVEAGALPSAL